ncbi:TM2 domain-containing protein [Labilibacter sediminis]|nr:TM2 domain-containing protein [Labilibacter sediminis]
MNRIIKLFPEIDLEEATFIDAMLKEQSDEQVQTFANVYRSRRRDPQMILILTAIGFLGISGIHRFFLNHIGMGVLYFFTAGLCFIGTIVDLVNYKALALEYNQKVALEVKTYLFR